MKGERRARREGCACQKEKTPKYPKWRECGAFEEQKNVQDGGSKDGDEVQELGQAPPGLEHDHVCPWHNGQNK